MNLRFSKEIEIPFDKYSDKILDQIVDILIEDIKYQVSNNYRTGPFNIDKESIKNSIKNGSMGIIFTMSNPPKPELIVIPNE